MKVNALVDEGVAPLVAALNSVPGLITLDSCEGYQLDAHVYFVYGDSAHELLDLIAEIGDVIRATQLDDGFLIGLEYLGSNDQPRAILKMGRGHVAVASDAIQQWSASRPTSAHTSRSTGGT